MYGKKRNLLLLDNNVLYSSHLKKIVSTIKESGFIKKPNFIRPLEYEIFMGMYKNKNRINYDVNKVIKSLSEFTRRIINKKDSAEYCSAVNEIKHSRNKLRSLWIKRSALLPILNKYRSKVLIQRYVDFNQGIDARLLDDEKLSILSEIPIRPLRIAFDSWHQNKIYEKAVRLSAAYGFSDISNYMLYNYKDRPEDLWYRINLNTFLRQELNIDIFSFPMKYTPVSEIDRKYIGKHWNKKYIRAIQSVLLVKKGIVSTNKKFVEKAFGSTVEE